MKPRKACATPADAALPLVLVQKVKGALRISAVDSLAQSLGLQPGWTLAEARARVPRLAVADADAAADQRLLLRLAEICDCYTPLVAVDGSDGLLLDVTGCSHLFQGEAAMCQRVLRHMARLGLSSRIALAGTPDAAQVLARHGNGGVVLPGQEREAVRTLPVQALGLEAAQTMALVRAGLKTIGALAERPAKVLAARFGTALTTRLARVLGQENVRITPLRAAPALRVEQHFAEPLQDMDNAMAVLAQLCQQMEQMLAQRGLGGRRFEAAFFRSDGAHRRVSVDTAQPLRDRQSVLRLMALKIGLLQDPLSPGFGFDGMALCVLQHGPITAAQRDLDGQGPDERSTHDLVDRLVARFGRTNVLRFVAQDTHNPLRMAEAVPVGMAEQAGSSSTAWNPLMPGPAPARPLFVFDPPQAIAVVAEVPDGAPVRFRWRRVQHEVRAAEGPERIAPEWWREDSWPHARDYYRVENTLGHRFWIYRDGPFEQGKPARWFLHGLFA